MSVLTVCKNVIMSNNKRKWTDPSPPIRIANTKTTKATDHAFVTEILDKNGEMVALLTTSADGQPIVKCGAKVAIMTKYPVRKVS